MKNYVIKFRHIIPTFLLIATCTVGGLLIIRWLTSIATMTIDIHEEIWELWLPFTIPIIPILIWLRPKHRILKPAKDGRTWGDFFMIVAWLSIVASSSVSQMYLSGATGKLQHLTNVYQVGNNEASRYYSIDNFGVMTQMAGLHSKISVSGKYNDDLNFNIYIVAPIVSDTSSDESGNPIIDLTKTPKYWYGITFHERISNRLSVKEKEKKFEVFYNDCIAKYQVCNFKDLEYFERVPTSKKKEYFLEAIKSRIQYEDNNELIVLTQKHEHYKTRTGNKLFWIFGSLGIGLIIFAGFLAVPDLNKRELARQKAGIKPEKDSIIEALKYLIPRGDHFVTSIIINLNILVFLLMFLSGVDPLHPDAIDLFKWGGNRSYQTTHGEWWRLLTSIFIHGGIMHLALNIAGLVIGSIFTEPIFGRRNYVILYILSGISGSLLSAWWHELDNPVCIGASGAIFGLFGSILGLLLTNAFPKTDKKGIFYFYWFICRC